MHKLGKAADEIRAAAEARRHFFPPELAAYNLMLADDGP